MGNTGIQTQNINPSKSIVIPKTVTITNAPPECPFCKRIRELLKGGLGMLRSN